MFLCIHVKPLGLYLADKNDDEAAYPSLSSSFIPAPRLTYAMSFLFNLACVFML